MRSKPIVARPGGEEKAVTCVTGPRPLHAPGPLALVTSGETRSMSAMKPGLY
jgi:hypothetical protein